MLIKAGVDISRLERNTRRSLKVVSDIFLECGEEAVITSTYEGNHRPDSLHYADEAYDVRQPKDSKLRIFGKIKKKLGSDFDVVLERDHYHIEHDPK